MNLTRTEWLMAAKAALKSAGKWPALEKKIGEAEKMADDDWEKHKETFNAEAW